MQQGTITGRQLRAARMLLRWTSRELCNRVGCAQSTIARIEKMDGPITGMRNETYADLLKTLEDAGIRLIHTDDETGVTLRKAPNK